MLGNRMVAYLAKSAVGACAQCATAVGYLMVMRIQGWSKIWDLSKLPINYHLKTKKLFPVMDSDLRPKKRSPLHSFERSQKLNNSFAVTQRHSARHCTGQSSTRKRTFLVDYFATRMPYALFLIVWLSFSSDSAHVNLKGCSENC